MAQHTIVAQFAMGSSGRPVHVASVAPLLLEYNVVDHDPDRIRIALAVQSSWVVFLNTLSEARIPPRNDPRVCEARDQHRGKPDGSAGDTTDAESSGMKSGVQLQETGHDDQKTVPHAGGVNQSHEGQVVTQQGASHTTAATKDVGLAILRIVLRRAVLSKPRRKRRAAIRGCGPFDWRLPQSAWSGGDVTRPCHVVDHGCKLS
mmetsp:Transcript_69939/g.186332  ORF Transcript_69939/g.186332 Transcript_69939/m.186332 type:complete len:204 (-) Transcript_69939:7-618(-)